MLDGIVQVACEAQEGVGSRAVELAMRVDRVHERVVDQSVDVTLPLKEELSVDIPVHPGMEDIVKAVRRLRPLERVQHRTVEQAVSLSPRRRVQQQTAERMVEPASTARERR